MFACKRLFGSCLAALLALPVCSSGLIAADYSASESDGPVTPTKQIRKAVAASDWSSQVSNEEEVESPTSLEGQLRRRGRVTVINPEGINIPAPAAPSLASFQSESQSPMAAFQTQSQSPCVGADGVCSTCQQTPCCCDSNFWQHRSFVFGEYLYMKSYGPDFVHATQQQAAPAGVGTVPFGTAQNLIQPWQSAFRVGGGYACSNCSSITVAYTQFASHTNDTLGLPVGGNLPTSVISSVLVPGSINAGTTFSQINAVSGVNFKTADVMYSRLIAGGDNYYVNFDIGGRFAHLQQGFLQNAQFAQPNNPQFTTSNINFDGGGLRAGFDGRRRIGCGGLSAYANGFFSAMFGDFNSHYVQTNSLTTAIVGANNFESARVVPILEYEVGVSWTSCNGCFRFGAGYYTAFWFNAVTNPQYIQSVQNNSFVKLGDTITFTGLVAHAEVRF